MELVQSALERLGHLFYIVNPFTVSKCTSLLFSRTFSFTVFSLQTSFRTKEEVPHYVSDVRHLLLFFFFCGKQYRDVKFLDLQLQYLDGQAVWKNGTMLRHFSKLTL